MGNLPIGAQERAAGQEFCTEVGHRLCLKNDIPHAWRGVRTKRYTYARFEDKPWCLFDNKKDPYQLNNLLGKPEYTELQSRLDKILGEQMARTQDSWATNFDTSQTLYKGPAVYHPDELKNKGP